MTTENYYNIWDFPLNLYNFYEKIILLKHQLPAARWNMCRFAIPFEGFCYY